MDDNLGVTWNPVVDGHFPSKVKRKKIMRNEGLKNTKR